MGREKSYFDFNCTFIFHLKL